MYIKFLASCRYSFESSCGYCCFSIYTYTHNFKALHLSKLKNKLYKNYYIPTILSLV